MAAKHLKQKADIRRHPPTPSLPHLPSHTFPPTPSHNQTVAEVVLTTQPSNDMEPAPSSSPSPPLPSPSPSISSVAISSDPSTGVTIDRENSPGKKGGRRPKFTPSDDLIIAREVSAAKAHMAGYGEIQKKFAIAATRANSNIKLSLKVTPKSIQDRYKKIQDAFDRKDQADRRLSGVGGEIGELDELLGMMAEARNDLNREKKAQIAAQEEKEAKKEQIGRDLVAKSLRRKLNSASEDDENEDNRGEDLGRVRKKKRNSRHQGAEGVEGELELFGDAMKEADMARVAMEKDRLEFDRERYALELEEREKDRQARKEERAEQNELELEKFKLMMGAFMKARKE